MAPVSRNHAKKTDSLVNIEREFAGIKDQFHCQENMLKHISETISGIATLLATRNETQHDPFETKHQDIPYVESSQQGENYHHHSSFKNHHQAFTDSSGWNHFPIIDVNKFNGLDSAG